MTEYSIHSTEWTHSTECQGGEIVTSHVLIRLVAVISIEMALVARSRQLSRSRQLLCLDRALSCWSDNFSTALTFIVCIIRLSKSLLISFLWLSPFCVVTTCSGLFEVIWRFCSSTSVLSLHLSCFCCFVSVRFFFF